MLTPKKKHTHNVALRSIEGAPGIPHPNEVSARQATTSKFVQRGRARNEMSNNKTAACGDRR